MNGSASMCSERKEIVCGELSGAYSYVTWKVPGFLDLMRPMGFDVKSQEFRFAGASWRLELFEIMFGSGKIGVRLQRSSSSVPEHRVSFTLRLIRGDEVGGGVGGNHMKYCFSQNGPVLQPLARILMPTHIFKSSNIIAPDGSVTVSCQMSLETPDGSDIPQTVDVPPIAPEPSQEEELRKRSPGLEKLQTDYKKLLKSGAASDVCLVVSGKEFRAHKSVLMARSPVFCAMFQHETEEKASGKVHIEDLDPDSFRDFLEYVYAGRVEAFSDDNVFGLYVAADKYDLQTLKSECLEYMRRSLSVDTFCDVIKLSLRYKEEDLMDLAIDFFKKNMPKIIVTVKWQVFLNENGTQANEILIKAFVPVADKS